jgi:hypothetical protein
VCSSTTNSSTISVKGGVDLEERAEGLLETGLVAMAGHEIELITNRCQTAMLPNGRLIARRGQHWPPHALDRSMSRGPVGLLSATRSKRGAAPQCTQVVDNYEDIYPWFSRRSRFTCSPRTSMPLMAPWIPFASSTRLRPAAAAAYPSDTRQVTHLGPLGKHGNHERNTNPHN